MPKMLLGATCTRKSIYGTSASPFAELSWGRCTQRVNADGTTRYLHVFDWPTDGKLIVPLPTGTVAGARLLENQQTLTTTRTDSGLTIQLPAAAPDAHVSVIELSTR